jgi:ATP-dependent DNA helicase RecQ
MPERDGGKSKIAESRKPEDGRVLSVYGDPGLGKLVQEQKGRKTHYSDQLVDAAVAHIQKDWKPDPEPTWVTAVPSYSRKGQVEDLAERIGDRLGIPYETALRKTEETRPQHELANSYQKRWNIEGVLEVTESMRQGPFLLIDDTVNSRWTPKEAEMTLRDAGSGAVYPFALAKRTK